MSGAAMDSLRSGGAHVRVSPHPVRKFVERLASHDLQEFPEWDPTKELPKLPVPPLKETMRNYLRCIEPVVDEISYRNTENLVNEFIKDGGVGEKLQDDLNEFAETTDNWVYRYWLEDMYLNAKLPLPINSNVSMVFPKEARFLDSSERIRFAARLITGILDYKTILNTRALPIDRATSRVKGQPLCMEQYYRLFSTYREPGVDQDRQIIDTSQHNKQPEYVIVICHNQLFVLDVVQNGARLSNDNTYTQLKRIMRMAEDGVDEDDQKVGILTAADRPTWARIRQILKQDKANAESLSLIEKCIFVLCLDKSCGTDGSRDEASLALQMLHGHGMALNSANRWYDKTMQFVIGEDGACGLNYEHSPSEGIAVVQLIEHLLKYMEEIRTRKLARMNTMKELPNPRKLRWNLGAEALEVIEQTSSNISRMISNIDLHILKFSDFGKDFVKSQNMSPDAFIQLALQLTYFKVHGRLVSTYESASIRRFRLGRVDNIRACTMEALRWCQAVTSGQGCTDDEKMKLFKEAIKRQTDILVQAILGHGIDNHLLGLRRRAEALGIDCPIFGDPNYRNSNRFTLSTSQVPTTNDSFMCYGPVVPDGYGACYNPHPDRVLVVITSFESCGDTRSPHFAQVLAESFRQMRQLCLDAGQSNGC